MQKYTKGTPAEAPSKADAKAHVAPVVNEEVLVDDEDEEGETVAISRVDDYEIVSKDEEEDMDALLGMCVLPSCTELPKFSFHVDAEILLGFRLIINMLVLAGTYWGLMKRMFSPNV